MPRGPTPPWESPYGLGGMVGCSLVWGPPQQCPHGDLSTIPLPLVPTWLYPPQTLRNPISSTPSPLPVCGYILRCFICVKDGWKRFFVKPESPNPHMIPGPGNNIRRDAESSQSWVLQPLNPGVTAGQVDRQTEAASRTSPG